MKHIVLITIRHDADPRDVSALVARAPSILARGPFTSAQAGVGAGSLPGAAQWGFIAEAESAEDVRAWSQSTAHEALLRLLEPVMESAATIQFAPDDLRAV